MDKTVLPFVSTVPEKLKNPCTAEKPCEAPYTFRSNMRLSPDTDEFDKIVKKINHSSNLDAPEAGLDAMMQGKHHKYSCAVAFNTTLYLVCRYASQVRKSLILSFILPY